MDITKNQLRFRKIGVITIIAVYFLIAVGGIVRSTGSGMGCPDWPKCFGQWIPPTDISQLPKGYKDIYANKRKAKNIKLAKYLQILGFSELSSLMLEDNSMYEEADFNVLKTWIEYINRLIGVVIGFLIFLTLIFSFSYLKSNSIVFYAALSSFVLVGIQGWLGSVVVSTNLLPGMITLHMLLAILITCCLIYALIKSYQGGIQVENIKNKKLLNLILLFALGITIIQIVFGTQVREAIDLIAKKIGEGQRLNWVWNVGNTFYVHRSFSWLVLISHLSLIYLLHNSLKEDRGLLYKTTLILLLCVFGEIVSGATMAYFSIPAFLQPIHLLLSTIIVGIQFMLWMFINQKAIYNKRQSKNSEGDYALYTNR